MSISSSGTSLSLTSSSNTIATSNSESSKSDQTENSTLPTLSTHSGTHSTHSNSRTISRTTSRTRKSSQSSQSSNTTLSGSSSHNDTIHSNSRRRGSHSRPQSENSTIPEQGAVPYLSIGSQHSESYDSLPVPQHESHVSPTHAHLVSQDWNTHAATTQPSRWSRFWNSTRGRFLLGLSGVATFRACYDRARGHVANRAGAMLVRYDTNAQVVGTNTHDPQQEAKADGHWELRGVAASGILGFAPNIASALIGTVVGGIARLFNGGSISRQEMEREIKAAGSPKEYVGLAQAELAERMVDSGRVKSVRQGLQMALGARSSGRDEQLSAGVRAFRALRRQLFHGPPDSRPFELALALNLLLKLHLSGDHPPYTEALRKDCEYVLREFSDLLALQNSSFEEIADSLRSCSASTIALTRYRLQNACNDMIQKVELSVNAVWRKIT